MICACIDIGSNTTRLLVAEARDGRLRELRTERAFTRIGASLVTQDSIPEAKIAETADVVRAQATVARELGAGAVVVVATAAIRTARNRDALIAAIERAGGLASSVLSGDEEARLSFVGATRTLPEPAAGAVAVVDVGGGSTELAVGAPRRMTWCESLAIGSGMLADSYLRSDPPGANALGAVRRRVDEAVAGLEPPPAQSAVAVGGTATSLRRLVGGELVPDALEGGLALLARTPIAEVARRFELDAERVRLLPAGIVVLQAMSELLALPLRLARGGLREGILLELLEGRRLA